MRRIQPDAVKEVQPRSGKIGKVAVRQPLFQRLRRDIRGHGVTVVAQHPVDFIAPRGHGGVDGVLNPAFPRLAGEHSRHHLARAEQTAGVGLRRHVLKRHIGIVAPDGRQHVLIERAFGVALACLLQQHPAHLRHQRRIRRDFP